MHKYKKLLAIVSGLDKFHLFVFGKFVIVEANHLPLIRIFKTNEGSLWNNVVANSTK